MSIFMQCLISLSSCVALLPLLRSTINTSSFFKYYASSLKSTYSLVHFPLFFLLIQQSNKDTYLLLFNQFL